MKKKKLYTIKSTGFKTPEHYFESIEKRMMKPIAEDKNLRKIKHSGFDIPFDYFDNVEEAVLSQLKDEKNQKVIPFFSKTRFYYTVGIAASILLIISIFLNSSKPETLSVDMVENYLFETDLNSYELAQLLSDANLLEDDFIIVETNFEEDSLESYLIDNTDIEMILD